MKEFLNKIINHLDLSKDEMTILIENLMKGLYNDIQISGLLTAFAIKSCTPEELAAAATAMRRFCQRLNLTPSDSIEMVSTGACTLNRFNISTSAMFIALGAGVKIIKHGHHAPFAKEGSSAVLEMLGINTHLTPEESEELLQRTDLSCFSRILLHPGIERTLPARNFLKICTLFNYLEPMINPLRAKIQLIGVHSRQCQEIMAQAFLKLGEEHVILLYGMDGLDEITTLADTWVIEIKGKELKRYTLKPEEFGFKRSSISHIIGGNISQRALLIKQILEGRRGPKRDIALLNAAAAITFAGKAKSLKEGLCLAVQSIESGRAREKLDELVGIAVN